MEMEGYVDIPGRFKGGLVDIVAICLESWRGIQNTKPMLFP
jgi:hypothetical protein